MRTSRSAFSLVELAVVLAVLGLLVGGIIGGQSMIRSMHVRSVIADGNLYHAALHQFKEKYSYLPGDFPTATEVWGRADGGTPISDNCADPLNTPSVGDATCNGDGDGLIQTHSVDATGNPDETMRAWQQLAAADLINGSFTGVSTTGGALDSEDQGSKIGVNLPVTSIKNGTFFIYSGSDSESDTYYPGAYGNSLIFGYAPDADVVASLSLISSAYASPSIVYPVFPPKPSLSAKEAHSIDSKADDGMPALGNLVTFKNSGRLDTEYVCTTSDTAADARYDLTQTDSSAGCALIFTAAYGASLAAQ